MAAVPSNYDGQGFSLQRDKNRFVLPPQFRKTILESSGDEAVVCLTKHDRWPCLIGFGRSRVARFPEILDREEEAAARRGLDFDRDLRALQLNGFLAPPFDGSGRFVMPEHLANLVGIRQQVYFQGAGDFFTLWDPATLMTMGAGWEVAQATCASLAARETAKAAKG